MQKTVYCWIFLVVVCVSCGKRRDYLEDALRLAGDNRPELEKVLAHYRQHPEDSLKYRAAVFLIENMPWHLSVDYPDIEDYYNQISSIYAIKNKTRKQAEELIRQIVVDYQKINHVYDIRTIGTSYLINHIDQIFETRNYPWTQSVSWEDFCEYVLPYRTSQEPIEDWLPLYRKRMTPLLDSLAAIRAPDSLVCNKFMSLFKPEGFLSGLSFSIPLKPSLYLDINVGTCHDLALFSQYVMRTAGLPVSYDFTPQWANRTLGHEWNAIVSNDEAITFQIGDDVPFGEHLRSKWSDKLAKAYRKTFSPQEESLPMQRPKEDIPSLFGSPLLRDVSEYYFTPVDIKVELSYPPPNKKQYAYLMVFNNREWSPVAWGRIRNGRVTFSKANTGCMYLVMYYDNGRFYTACDPFYLDDEGNKKILIPRLQNRENVTIVRKYPFHDTAVLTEHMPGGKFQIANRTDFNDAITIHTIDTLKNMTFHYIHSDNMPACRYFRYLSSDKGHVFMAEITVYDSDGNKLTGKIIGTDGSWEDKGANKYKVFDGNYLTFFNAPVAAGCWVGLDFEEKKHIKKIRYLPKNDDNNINEDEEYELFYYDREWISLGIKTGDSTHLLNYNNVPENALLWLRNHTKGHQERIFTYENGKQVWW